MVVVAAARVVIVEKKSFTEKSPIAEYFVLLNLLPLKCAYSKLY